MEDVIVGFQQLVQEEDPEKGYVQKSIFEAQEAQDKRFKPLITDKGWICVKGSYDDGVITCKAPVLDLD